MCQADMPELDSRSDDGLRILFLAKIVHEFLYSPVGGGGTGGNSGNGFFLGILPAELLPGFQVIGFG